MRRVSATEKRYVAMCNSDQLAALAPAQIGCDCVGETGRLCGHMRRLLSIGLMLTLGGCVTAYVEPPASNESASIIFTRSESVPRWGHTQALQIVSDDRCSSRNRIKEFVPLGSREPYSFRVSASGRQFFMVETSRTTYGAHGFVDATCSNVVSFVPQAGRRYRLTHERRPEACSVDIVETETGATAPGFTNHPFDRACTSVW